MLDPGLGFRVQDLGFVVITLDLSRVLTTPCCPVLPLGVYFFTIGFRGLGFRVSGLGLRARGSKSRPCFLCALLSAQEP